jgi:hypothetical protein
LIMDRRIMNELSQEIKKARILCNNLKKENTQYLDMLIKLQEENQRLKERNSQLEISIQKHAYILNEEFRKLSI